MQAFISASKSATPARDLNSLGFGSIQSTDGDLTLDVDTYKYFLSQQFDQSGVNQIIVAGGQRAIHLADDRAKLDAFFADYATTGLISRLSSVSDVTATDVNTASGLGQRVDVTIAELTELNTLLNALSLIHI